MATSNYQAESFQDIRGRNAWHRDTAVEVVDMTLDQQLTAAKLDWKVETSSFIYGDDYQHEELKTQVAYRADTGAFIDVYTSRKPWQNREIVGHFHDFCNEAGLKLTHLGNLDGGRTIYAAAYMSATDVLSVGDFTDHYLILRDSHINGRGLNVSLFSNRCICTNGMHVTIRVGSKTIAHLGEFNAARINELLDAAMSTLKVKSQTSETLAAIAITREEAVINLISAFGIAGEPVSEQPKVVQVALKLFDGDGKGSELLSSYNTAYGLLQSVTEYFNWHGRNTGAVKQFQSVLNGSRATQMQKFEQQLVGVYIN